MKIFEMENVNKNEGTLEPEGLACLCGCMCGAASGHGHGNGAVLPE